MTTRDELHAEMTELLGTEPVNEPIINERILEVMRSHKQWNQKSGGGKHHLRKKANGRLFLYDHDGREVEPMSYNTAISAHIGLKKRRTDWKARAMRMAVQSQVVRFREERGILGNGKVEIDHCNQGGFHGLCQAWMRVEGICPADIRIKKLKSGFFTMADKAVRARWARYHQEHARLQALPVDEHRRMTTERRREVVE